MKIFNLFKSTSGKYSLYLSTIAPLLTWLPRINIIYIELPDGRIYLSVGVSKNIGKRIKEHCQCSENGSKKSHLL